MPVTELHPHTVGKYVVRTIEIDEKAMKAAALEADGESHAVAYHLAKLDAANPRRKQAEREISDGERNHANRVADLKLCQHQLGRTKPRIIVSTRKRYEDAHQSRVQTALAGVYIVGAAASLAVSNYVGADFIVGSGSDLFALDVWGARAFYIVPVIAALGTAAYEYNHRHDQERFRYRTSFFAVGLVAFITWALAGAITFAPTGGTTNWASTGTASMVMGGILLFAHILVDATMGSVIMSTAVSMLIGDRIIERKDNPEYVGLCEQRKALEEETAEISAFIGVAADYLQSLADARKYLMGEVHFAFRFNAARHAGAQQERTGKTTLDYLTA